ncbi:GGDEF domain-containing protein [Granulicella arctica]|uniref:GGDEF domain-containing protein n=1 Tax=Granulicella arctica TaxID=940613 RepID=UPI0021E079F5|nr:GGDEF domain-containing protein [Granulicella arctica]
MLFAELCILLALVLLHVGVLELAASSSLIPIFGIALLALLVGSDLYRLYGGAGTRFCIAVFGLLIAGQLIETAIRLLSISRHGGRLPAQFTALVLLGAVATNLMRSVKAIFGLSWAPNVAVQLEELTVIAYTVAILGVAFGLFWTSTTMRASGFEHMANTDSLTRLFNRRIFLLWCEKEWVRSQKTGAFFSILMIDLDHFKSINDTFGHHAGDLALCAAVEKIQDAMRGIDVIGRWGGEEFAALLPGANLEAAHLVAERVRRNIEKVSLPPAPKVETSERHPTANLTACVGIATHLNALDTVHAMMQRADKALYVAKAGGRNRIAGEAV